jgi:hypothetical protein
LRGDAAQVGRHLDDHRSPASSLPLHPSLPFFCHHHLCRCPMHPLALFLCSPSSPARHSRSSQSKGALAREHANNTMGSRQDKHRNQGEVTSQAFPWQAPSSKRARSHRLGHIITSPILKLKFYFWIWRPKKNPKMSLPPILGAGGRGCDLGGETGNRW